MCSFKGVVPAIEKQIHYFIYGIKSKPIEWYYGHFPTPISFLEHGAIMTGEASPGYLPYPSVPRDVKKIYSGKNGKPTPPKIIVVGREPFDRIYSSYRYNYVVPTIELLRKKGHPRLSTQKDGFQKGHPSDEYYEQYLYTLEEFVRSELSQLKKCLFEWGALRTYEKWRTDFVYKEELKIRFQNEYNQSTYSNGSHPPLIDLDGVCYGKSVNKTVYRVQWTDMQMKQPNKVIINRNLHLTQALIGRSLYAFPLDWWYLNFNNSETDITFLCTEDLKNPETMNELASRLGLPSYDGFDDVIGEGAYNVGGHRGYDKATTWDELWLEQNQQNQTVEALKMDPLSKTTGTRSSSGVVSSARMTSGIPLPEDLYKELKDFVDPLNERLFALTGKRCDW